MSKLHIRGHYEWQGLNIEQKGQTINFWLTPPNEQVQPLVVTITRDDLVTTALYSLLAQALTNPKELPHWRATLTTPANFATKLKLLSDQRRIDRHVQL